MTKRREYEVGQRLHRVVDGTRSNGAFDLDGDWWSSGIYRVEIRWEEWEVEGATPKGYWVRQVTDGRFRRIYQPLRKWISATNRSRLRLAPTKDEALELTIAARTYHHKKASERLERIKRRLTTLQQLRSAGQEVV